MTQENTTQEIYRKLSYFYENGIEVHFKKHNGIWCNGLILDISENKRVFVLKERVKGEIPVLFEEVRNDTLVKYQKEGRE